MPETSDLVRARRHLARRDPVLKPLVQRIGPCTLTHNPDGFSTLVGSIISQQISGKAADTITRRLFAALEPEGLNPATLRVLSDETLRACGVSANKVRSLRDLAERTHAGTVPLDRLADLDDEQVIETLLPIRGIGRWTAQMFLIFSLGRRDVLAVDDLGLKTGVKELYGLTELPGREQLTNLAEPWRPFRSIATWYLWRSRGPVPQSE